MNLESQICTKLGMTEDALLIEIGHNVGMFEAPPPDEVAKGAGLRWIDRQHDQIKGIICTPNIQSALNKSEYDLAVAVAQALASAFGDDGVATVAALFVKTGIRKLCEWN